MAQKCWGCNRQNISIFAWLGGDNLCRECKRNPSDSSVSENYKINLQQSLEKQDVRDKSSHAMAEKVYSHGRDFVSLVFGGAALIWFIVMLPAQWDFEGIIVGWAIIGGIYLLFKIFSRR